MEMAKGRGIKKLSKRSPTRALKVRVNKFSSGSRTRGPRTYRGVRVGSWRKWVSEIWDPTLGEKGKKIWLGSFETAEMAARAYDSAAFTLRGTSAQLNFPHLVHMLPHASSKDPEDITAAAQAAASINPGCRQAFLRMAISVDPGCMQASLRMAISGCTEIPSCRAEYVDHACAERSEGDNNYDVEALLANAEADLIASPTSMALWSADWVLDCSSELQDLNWANAEATVRVSPSRTDLWKAADFPLQIQSNDDDTSSKLKQQSPWDARSEGEGLGSNPVPKPIWETRSEVLGSNPVVCIESDQEEDGAEVVVYRKKFTLSDLLRDVYEDLHIQMKMDPNDLMLESHNRWVELNGEDGGSNGMAYQFWKYQYWVELNGKDGRSNGMAYQFWSWLKLKVRWILGLAER